MVQKKILLKSFKLDIICEWLIVIGFCKNQYCIKSGLYILQKKLSVHDKKLRTNDI